MKFLLKQAELKCTVIITFKLHQELVTCTCSLFTPKMGYGMSEHIIVISFFCTLNFIVLFLASV